jgi:hypothetical protein
MDFLERLFPNASFSGIRNPRRLFFPPDRPRGPHIYHLQQQSTETTLDGRLPKIQEFKRRLLDWGLGGQSSAISDKPDRPPLRQVTARLSDPNLPC